MAKISESPGILFLCENERSGQTDRRALRDAGFSSCRVMTSGIEAAKFLSSFDSDAAFWPSLVVCSQKLEDMDGEQFCAILRQHPLLLGFPVLLILSSDNEAEQLKTLGCGASALLGRPYSLEDLKKKLQSIQLPAPSRKMLKDAAAQVDTSAFDAALSTYGILLRADRDPEDYFKIGMASLEQRRWNVAISAFERALKHAQVKAEAELGMAAAFKGKGDMKSCKAWLANAALTFVSARRWHHARAAYGKLLRHEPSAKNPFIAEAHRLMRLREYNEAAHVLAQGLEVTPRNSAPERYAQLCFAAEDPDAMLKALEDGFAKDGSFGFLGNEIRQNLEILTRERQERQKEQAYERKQQIARTAAEREREKAAAAPAEPASSFKPVELAPEKPVILFGEESEADFDEADASPYDDDKDDKGVDGGAADAERPLDRAPEKGLDPGLFESSSKLGDLFSVMKLTWKLARNSAKNK